MVFANRKDAGQQLATALARYADTQALVLGIPRGGVEVGDEVARARHLSFTSSTLGGSDSTRWTIKWTTKPGCVTVLAFTCT